MRLHADSLELRRLRYGLIYTYKVVLGLVNGAANDLFTLTSLIHSTSTRGHTYKWGWTVIRSGHPDPSGFPLTGEIRLRPDSMWHGGSDFYDLQYPVLPYVQCHCAFFVNSWYQQHAVMTFDASQKNANRNLSLICTWMTRPASSWRWRFIGRPTSSQWYQFTEL